MDFRIINELQPRKKGQGKNMKKILLAIMLTVSVMADAPSVQSITQPKVPPAVVVSGIVLFPLVNGTFMLMQALGNVILTKDYCSGTIYGVNFKDGALNLQGWDNCAENYEYIEVTK